MKRRIIATAVGACTALAMAAGPAAAHVNARSGFIGPNPADNPTPHNGIECAAERNPNIGSIAAFECPRP